MFSIFSSQHMIYIAGAYGISLLALIITAFKSYRFFIQSRAAYKNLRTDIEASSR